ncbi:MAG TPA: altronate dehydratase family protein [Terriglobales bacterium]|nr:altronate dehydratase family protein [Terriglobales bacterium]
MQKVLQLDPRDNVLIALTDLNIGEQVDFAGTMYTLVSNVPAKHKFVTADLPVASDVIMYGVLVGKTSQPVRRGELLTLNNLRHESAPFADRTGDFRWKAPDVSRWQHRQFFGYRRSDGQVGTRNYWIVIPLVFCENRNILNLKQAFEEELGFTAPSAYRQQVAAMVNAYRNGSDVETFPDTVQNKTAPPRPPKVFENVDGIRFLLHEGGCGGTHEDAQNLCGLIAGYIHHPNVAGATVLSLGCQHAQVDILREQLQRLNPKFDKPLFVFEQQKSGSELAMLSEAIRRTFEGLVEANHATRSPAPLSQICVGLQCGGSDGFSGLSANPAIGHTSDVLVALGARTILSEFPELCGVEQALINRCTTDAVAQRFMQLMQDYANRARAVRATFAMNPSPGNRRDGLLTDAMKSAGAAKKGGTSPVTAALDYPEYATTPGLNLQCTPGSDVESVTAQVGAGANIILFTTGLGTPTGNPITPVIKLSTNTPLATRMPDIIDLDTGPIVTGESDIKQMGERILDFVVQVASGEVRTKAEQKNQEDFIPWKRGVSL